MSSGTPARLSSELLSRKGMAAPSAEPEARATMVGSLLGAWGVSDATPAETTRPQPRQAPAPARSTLADWATPESAPSAGAQGRHGQVAQKRVRVSLRLDANRHTRLKLVATQRNCTLQSLFTETIDEFFIRHAPDLAGISAHLRRGAGATATAVIAVGGKVRHGKRKMEGRNGPSRFR
ncbi:MAG: hypothetical protein ACTSQ7_02130 [Alphaproteobacteria bacterium]